MTKMNDLEKVKSLVALLEKNDNRITPEQLLAECGTPRRQRRALFIARKGGMVLEPVRDGGRKVVAYVRVGNTTFADVQAALASTRKRKPKVAPVEQTEEAATS